MLIVAALVASLVGCASVPLVDATPAQRLYASDGAYRALLELSVAYKESCAARPYDLQTNCRRVVATLRSIDDRYALLRRQVTTATPTADDAALVEALVAEMQTALARETAP